MHIDPEVRKGIQAGSESLRVLAKRYGVNIKTVARWRARDEVVDARLGRPLGTLVAMTLQQEAIAVFIRRHTLLPLDDCLYALATIMPGISRAALYRCFTRHGIGRIPRSMETANTLGHIKLDLCPIPSGEGVVYLYFAIELRSRFIYSEVLPGCDERQSAAFLARLHEACPVNIRHVLIRSISEMPLDKGALPAFCKKHEAELALLDCDGPWSPEQVRQMDVIYVPPSDVAFYRNVQAANDRVRQFDKDFNFGRKLKSLRGLTPMQFLRRAWVSDPEQFRTEPCAIEPRCSPIF